MCVNGFGLNMYQYIYVYVRSFHPQLIYPKQDGVAEVVLNDMHTILDVSWSCGNDVDVPFSNVCFLTIVMFASAGLSTLFPNCLKNPGMSQTVRPPSPKGDCMIRFYGVVYAK